ncbi:hypothetical protein ACQKNO_24735 [Bacillus paramycoides]|uniref:hypothetical protein n=1 Tax=Bacillus paramycoides TaxID=2026194 RepID=UPI003D07CA49
MRENEKRKNEKVILNAILGMTLTVGYILFAFILPEMFDSPMPNSIKTIDDYIVFPLYILTVSILAINSWKAVLKKDK